MGVLPGVLLPPYENAAQPQGDLLPTEKRQIIPCLVPLTQSLKVLMYLPYPLADLGIQFPPNQVCSKLSM